MAFGPVNVGGGATGRTMEEINARIWAVLQAAEEALREHIGSENPHGITTDGIGAVPVTRKINRKPLSGDVTLGAGDVGAVPVARSVNGKQLVTDIKLNAQDVGAAEAGHSHSPASLGAAAANHTHSFEGLSGKVFHAGTSAPASTGLLWIDTNAATGGLKYHNGSAWVHVPVAYT